MDFYTQAIHVKFRSEAAARKARLRIAPLYHDLRAAFSTRMDDTNVNALSVAEVMTQFGQKGTFFLNDPNIWWEDNAYYGAAMISHPGVEIPRSLLSKGHSIGGHTLSHEYLPALSKNSAFHEIMGVRVALEVQTSSPVTSFTYPFVYFRSEVRAGQDRADLEEALRRSGYYQLAEDNYNKGGDSGLQDGIFIVCDGEKWHNVTEESIIRQALAPGRYPLLLVAMHPWIKHWGGLGLPRLASVYSKWSGRKNWWYCNLNDYGAYRYQARHSRLDAIVDGDVLNAELTRPDPLDLSNDIPLTLVVEGVPRREVVSAGCEHSNLESTPIKSTYAFDLFHEHGRGSAEKFAETANPANASRIEGVRGSTNGLRALLCRKGRVLTLRLRNDGAAPLQDIRVVFRVALRWEEGAVRRNVKSLAAGASVALRVGLTERSNSEEYDVGPEYSVAQIDFRRRRRVRLYATCRMPDRAPRSCFARNGFWVIGPLPGDMNELDPQVFSSSYPRGIKTDREYTAPWGRSLAWKPPEASKIAFLDPDIIPTTGSSRADDFYKWHSSSQRVSTKIHYILQGRVVSLRRRTVRAVFFRANVRRLSLNGRIVKGVRLKLEKGDNDIRILYEPPISSDSQFSERNYGCYFRVTDAKGNRIKDLRFSRPPTPRGLS